MRIRIPYPVRYAAFALFLAVTCFILGRGALELASTVPVSGSSDGIGERGGEENETAPLLVIDPGHGGEDGGASPAGILTLPRQTHAKNTHSVTSAKIT